MKRFEYKCSKNGHKSALEMVKWMRRNLGERGVDWDFSYHIGTDMLVIECRGDKQAVMVELIM